MKRSNSNELTVFWDQKRNQLRLTAGGTIAVIAVPLALVALYFIAKYF
jgi:hypothetical protein